MDPASFNEDYIRRLQAGDAETERHFTGYFGELLRVRLRRRNLAVQLADDICQETFARVLDAIRSDRLQNPERLGAFILSICDHVLFEFHRQEGKFPAGEMADFPDHRVSPDRALLTAERLRIVRSILQELSPKDRQALRMVFFEERDSDEVSRALGVTPDYLRVVLHRARLRLRTKLEKSDADFQPTVKRLKRVFHNTSRRAHS